MRERINLENAIEKCCAAQKPRCQVEAVPVENGYYRVLARDLQALSDVPPFNSSRMDGYAICRSDWDLLNDMNETDYLSLQVIAHVPAGTCSLLKILPGQTVRIMTGAVTPPETAAVIKQEDVIRISESLVNINGGKRYPKNIQLQGNIIRAGQELAAAGELLFDRQVERLASSGIDQLPVHRKPIVYVINTGSELVLPGSSLPEGKMFNSNRSLFTAKLQRENCQVVIDQCPREDKLADIYQAIEHTLEAADMVIVTGGAADGDYDLVPLALEKLKAEFIFRGLLMQPGAKSSAAVRQDKLIFNMPGNPDAGDILFEVLILPVLNRLKGMKSYSNKWFSIYLSGNTIKPSPLRRMYRGELVEEQGLITARLHSKNKPGQGIKPVILDIQPGQGNENDMVKVMLV